MGSVTRYYLATTIISPPCCLASFLSFSASLFRSTAFCRFSPNGSLSFLYDEISASVLLNGFCFQCFIFVGFSTSSVVCDDASLIASIPHHFFPLSTFVSSLRRFASESVPLPPYLPGHNYYGHDLAVIVEGCGEGWQSGARLCVLNHAVCGPWRFC